jgi:hypothetical protein
MYLTHAQTAIYDSKVKLFLKQGISRQLGGGWTQLFDLNARIQQLTWSLIFYEKYSTSQSYRHGMCFRVSSVFVLSILFWFPQRTHYFWHVLRFLFMEHKQDYSWHLSETTMHGKVTCILYKKQAHFSQLFCLQVRSVTPWQLHDRKSRCLRGRRHS